MKIVDKSEKEIEAPYELPEGWKWCRLGDTCEMYQPQTISTKDLIENGDYLVYGANGVIGRYNEYNHEKSQLLVTCRGATCGSVNISEPFSWINGNAMVISPFNSSILLKYMYYIFQSVVNFNKVITGSAQPQITRQSLIPVTFPLPSTLEEQQRIVNRIETLFAKLDQAKEKAQNVVDTFETRKASILHKAFIGELTKKWREENGVGDDSWTEKKLEECGKWERGRSKHRPRNAPELFGGEYPFIQTGDVANADVYINEHKQTLSEFGFNQSRLFPAGTLCITIAANIGKVAILSYDCCFPDSVVGFTPNENNDSKFMYYKINEIEKDLEELAPATAQKNLNLKLLTSVKLKVPMLPEQQEIVHILDVILEKETKAKESAEAVLEQIDLLKKSILARAFRGEL